MRKIKKNINTFLATTILMASFFVAVFAATESTSNWASATNSHIRWLGFGTSCDYYGEFSEHVPARTGAVYMIETKSKGIMVTEKLFANESFSGSSSANNIQWRGIIQYGKIIIEVYIV